MHYQHFTLSALPTLLVASCLFGQGIQGAQGQFASDPAAWGNHFNQVSAQISSARNYDLLQPIGSRPQPRNNRVLDNRPTTRGMLSPMASTQINTTLPAATTHNSPPTFSASTGTARPAAESRNTAANSIKVTPHSFQSGPMDKYEFKIHNPATQSLLNATVKLVAPAGSRVAQVIPKPKSVAGGEIVFEISELAPNGYQIVEVSIENPRDELIQFESSVVRQTWTGSQVSVSKDYGDLYGGGQIDRGQIGGDPIVSRELQLGPLMPLAGVELRLPIEPAQEAVETARRRLEQAKVPMDEVLQAEYEKAIAENAKRESLESPLTPENAFETQQFGGVTSLLNGPLEVAVGEEVEFAVELKNETAEAADSLIVQLSVPADLSVTLLDRAAWYDAESGKISWKVPAIAAQNVETIRYRVVARTAGLVKQGVVVGMDNKLQGFCTFKTQVR